MDIPKELLSKELYNSVYSSKNPIQQKYSTDNK